MKVTDLRRKLMAALVAGGTLAPSALYAADLNTNLVINGDFETVDVATFELDYNGPLILNWLGTQGFAYSHDGSSSNGGVVPDYADGADPPAPAIGTFRQTSRQISMRPASFTRTSMWRAAPAAQPSRPGPPGTVSPPT